MYINWLTDIQFDKIVELLREIKEIIQSLNKLLSKWIKDDPIFVLIIGVVSILFIPIFYYIWKILLGNSGKKIIKDILKIEFDFVFLIFLILLLSVVAMILAISFIIYSIIKQLF